jgi:hypothetical protein
LEKEMSIDAVRESISDGRLLVARLSMLGPFERPHKWEVDSEIRKALARLAGLTPVAITTSKPVAEARDTVGLDDVHIVGLSGGEIWPAGALLPEIDARIQASVFEIRKLIEEFRPRLQEAGADVEPHGVLHFSDRSGRADPDAREAVELVRMEAERRGLHVSHDDVAHTFKIRPADRETAAERLLATFQPDRVTFLGFDEWDVVLSDALKEAHETGRLTRLCIVGALYNGHSMPMQGRADCYVTDIEGVGTLIAQLATALTPRQYRISGSHLV